MAVYFFFVFARAVCLSACLSVSISLSASLCLSVSLSFFICLSLFSLSHTLTHSLYGRQSWWLSPVLEFTVMLWNPWVSMATACFVTALQLLSSASARDASPLSWHAAADLPCHYDLFTFPRLWPTVLPPSPRPRDVTLNRDISAAPSNLGTLYSLQCDLCYTANLCGNALKSTDWPARPMRGRFHLVQSCSGPTRSSLSTRRGTFTWRSENTLQKPPTPGWC